MTPFSAKLGGAQCHGSLWLPLAREQELSCSSAASQEQRPLCQLLLLHPRLPTSCWIPAHQGGPLKPSFQQQGGRKRGFNEPGLGKAIVSRHGSSSPIHFLKGEYLPALAPVAVSTQFGSKVQCREDPEAAVRGAALGSVSFPNQDRGEGEERTVAFQVSWKERADLAGKQRRALG